MCLILLTALGLQAQRPEYDFYREGRDKRPEAYAEELRKAGFRNDQIGVASRDSDVKAAGATTTEEGSHAALHAVSLVKGAGFIPPQSAVSSRQYGSHTFIPQWPPPSGPA